VSNDDFTTLFDFYETQLGIELKEETQPVVVMKNGKLYPSEVLHLLYDRDISHRHLTKELQFLAERNAEEF
jgi:hypothetical protein